MKRISMSLLLACLLLSVGCATGKQKVKTVTRVSLEETLASASSGRVHRVTIFYIPERTLPIEAINEKQLEHLYSGSVTIANFQRSNLRDALLQNLKQSSMEPKQNVSEDYRWGCVFFDVYGNRLLSLYFTAGGSGRVNDATVTTDGHFLNFLRDEFQWLTKNW